MTRMRRRRNAAATGPNTPFLPTSSDPETLEPPVAIPAYLVTCQQTGSGAYVIGGCDTPDMAGIIVERAALRIIVDNGTPPAPPVLYRNGDDWMLVCHDNAHYPSEIAVFRLWQRQPAGQGEPLPC